MPPAVERFDLEAATAAVAQACQALFCHALFDAALYGLLVAGVVFLAGCCLRNKKPGRPLMACGGKLIFFCLALTLPGLVCLFLSGSLPPVGVFHFSSLGFIVFWSIISLHLSAEEMNFQWFS